MLSRILHQVVAFEVSEKIKFSIDQGCYSLIMEGRCLNDCHQHAQQVYSQYEMTFSYLYIHSLNYPLRSWFLIVTTVLE